MEREGERKKGGKRDINGGEGEKGKIEIQMEAEEREEERDGERRGLTKRLIYMDCESVCVQGGEIETKKRDGWGYRYGWRVERGRNISLTRWIDINGDGDF